MHLSHCICEATHIPLNMNSNPLWYSEPSNLHNCCKNTHIKQCFKWMQQNLDALPHNSDPMMALQAQPNHHNGRYHCCKKNNPKQCSKWSDAWTQQKYNNLPTKPMVFHTIQIQHGIPSTTKSSQWRISSLHHHTHYEAML